MLGIYGIRNLLAIPEQKPCALESFFFFNKGSERGSENKFKVTKNLFSSKINECYHESERQSSVVGRNTWSLLILTRTTDFVLQ